MALELPDPPESLAPAPGRFYDELRQMLDSVRPTQVDPERTSVKFDGGGVQVEFVHLERDDWSISAAVGENHAIVATLNAKEDFFAPAGSRAGDRRWTTQIVDFVAEILRGEIEVDTTYRGRMPISVTHFNRDASGRRQRLDHVVVLTPEWLFLWRPKRTETERSSWL